MRRDIHLGICLGTYKEHGEEYFSQTVKLDELGKLFIKDKICVGKINIFDDTLEVDLNSSDLHEWKKIEAMIENIFCLPIKSRKRT